MLVSVNFVLHNTSFVYEWVFSVLTNTVYIEKKFKLLKLLKLYKNCKKPKTKEMKKLLNKV